MFDKFIKSSNFFPRYCPAVKNWVHKKRGKSGRGNDIQFTPEDIIMIEQGLLNLNRDLINSLHPPKTKTKFPPKK